MSDTENDSIVHLLKVTRPDWAALLHYIILQTRACFAIAQGPDSISIEARSFRFTFKMRHIKQQILLISIGAYFRPIKTFDGWWRI